MRRCLNLIVRSKKQRITEYDKKIPLILSTNEQMDIGWGGSPTFTSNLLMGAYADISEFVESDKEFYDMIGKDLWQGVSYEGGIYGIPTLKEIGEQWVLLAETEIMEKYNIDSSTINDFEDIEPLLEAHKQEGYIAGLAMRGREWSNLIGVAFSDDFHWFDNYSFAVIDPEEPEKVQSLYSTEKFAEFVNTMHRWYQEGYIHKEVLTNEKYRDDAGRRGIISLNYAPYAEVSQKNPCTVLYVTGNPVINNGAARGSVQVIFEKCENKERAYEFLKLWNTDPEVKNAFYHGVPDVHYKLVDGKVEYVENKSELYDSQNWCTGNTLIATLLTSEPDDKMEVYAAHTASASASPCLGIMFEDTKVADKVAVINNVLAEYLPPVLYGVVEPEKGIEQLNEQLKLAGMDEVIAECQAQYDAFLGK